MSLNMELPPEELFYYLVFESSYYADKPMYTAAIDNIRIQGGLCEIPGELNIKLVHYSPLAPHSLYVDNKGRANVHIVDSTRLITHLIRI